MRKSFNGLGEQVQHVLNVNPFSGHLFIFRGRRGDTVKADGAWLALMNFFIQTDGTSINLMAYRILKWRYSGRTIQAGTYTTGATRTAPRCALTETAPEISA